jgi:ribokinase
MSRSGEPRRGHVVVLGSANMDLTLRTDRLPARGETLLAGDAVLRPGGKGANQAVAASVGGASVTMVGCVGDDEHGAAVRSALQRADVDVSRLRAAPGHRTGLAVVLVEPDGENAIVVSPGANHAITPAEVPEVLGELQGADLLLLQMELPVEVVACAVSIAEAAAVPVVLNLAPATVLPTATMGALTVLVVNRSEAEFLLGRPLPTREALAAASTLLRGLGPDAVVVTAGADGAVFDDGAGPVHVPALPVEVVDTAGAGDAFVGVLAARFAAGQGLGEAVAAAAAAAADVVGTHGAQMPAGAGGE